MNDGAKESREDPPVLPSTYALKRIGPNTARVGEYATTTTTTKDSVGRASDVVSSAGQSKRAKTCPSRRSEKGVQPARHRRDEIRYKGEESWAKIAIRCRATDRSIDTGG